MASSEHPFHAPGLRIPRFLFRGFNSHSGGGLPGQNTTEGIVPRGFLLGYDTETELGSNVEPHRIKARAEMHVCHEKIAPTPFSSWTHEWFIALRFAYTRYSTTSRERIHLQGDDCGYVAVLDTWALGDEDMLRKKIFHVPQFGSHNSQCEWLIWGPVSGPAYRCVPVSAIQRTISCWRWPDVLVSKQAEPYLREAEVRDSLLIAGCFQRHDDDSSDVMLAVAAAELARQMWGAPYLIAPDRDLETDPVEPIWPRDLLQKLLGVFALCKPVLSGRPLVHGRTAVVGFPGVRLMYTLLLRTEARWRGCDADTTWNPVDWKQILRDHLRWTETSCACCAKREEDFV